MSTSYQYHIMHSQCGDVYLTLDEVDRCMHRGYVQCPVCGTPHISLRAVLAAIPHGVDVPYATIATTEEATA